MKPPAGLVDNDVPKSASRKGVVGRVLIGLGGVVLIGVGLFNLLDFGLVDLLWVAGWLAAGVALHDGVVAPSAGVVGRLGARRLSLRHRRVPVVALVCLGVLSLLALPLIGRMGAVAGNPTLLGRNYLLGWASACLLVLLGALVAEVLRRARVARDRRDGRDREREEATRSASD